MLQHGLLACRCGLAALPATGADAAIKRSSCKCFAHSCPGRSADQPAYSDLRTIEATWPGAVRCRRGCAISQGLGHQSRNAHCMQALLAVRTSRSVSQSGAAVSRSRFTPEHHACMYACGCCTHGSHGSTQAVRSVQQAMPIALSMNLGRGKAAAACRGSPSPHHAR